jgi:Leucine-rich repeat (LRR) protein
MWSCCQILFCLVPLVVGANLTVDNETQLTQMEYTILFRTGKKSQTKTDTIVSMIPDAREIFVDTMNNTILCNRMFKNLQNVSILVVHARNIVQIKSGFLRGQDLNETLEIIRGRIKCIRKHTFASLQIAILNLPDNKIATIEDEAFVNMSRLERISLEANLLAKVEPGSFVGLPQLVEFRAGANKIMHLQKSVFRFLRRNNSIVDVHENLIKFVDEDIFSGSSAENVELIMERNAIGDLPRRMFERGSFSRINLGYNNISHISPDFFQGRFHVEFLEIQCNPLDNETVQTIEIWATGNNISLQYLPLFSYSAIKTETSSLMFAMLMLLNLI